jgi:nucleoside 2-deoxyribosyltransferase
LGHTTASRTSFQCFANPGPDPDSGTAWEVGYAFGTKKPIVLVRTDFRALAGNAGDYSPMLTQAATARIDLPAASTTQTLRRPD